MHRFELPIHTYTCIRNVFIYIYMSVATRQLSARPVISGPSHVVGLGPQPINCQSIGNILRQYRAMHDIYMLHIYVYICICMCIYIYSFFSLSLYIYTYIHILEALDALRAALLDVIKCILCLHCTQCIQYMQCMNVYNALIQLFA